MVFFENLYTVGNNGIILTFVGAAVRSGDDICRPGVPNCILVVN